MTMISKYPLNEKIKNRVFNIFLETLASLKTINEVNAFLEQFLTPTEKIMLAKRLSIAFLLAKGYDVRTISKILKVSTKTVTNTNFWMKHDRRGLYSTIQNIIKQENSAQYLRELLYRIEKAVIPISPGNWSARRKVVEKDNHLRNKPPF